MTELYMAMEPQIADHRSRHCICRFKINGAHTYIHVIAFELCGQVWWMSLYFIYKKDISMHQSLGIIVNHLKCIFISTLFHNNGWGEVIATHKRMIGGGQLYTIRKWRSCRFYDSKCALRTSIMKTVRMTWKFSFILKIHAEQDSGCYSWHDAACVECMRVFWLRVCARGGLGCRGLKTDDCNSVWKNGSYP